MRRARRGFTLVEILVVLAIILLVTVVSIPLIQQFNGRQVVDGARVFTGTIAGARDSAIRANEPRGFRLIPDPTLTIPAPGQPGAGTIQLAYSRMIPIEPAGDHSVGRVSIGPMSPVTAAWPPAYPRAVAAGDTWPYPNPTTGLPDVLMVEESLYVGGYLIPNGGTIPQPNEPVNWNWNVRLGEKIRIGDTGREYTIVGPCQISPWGTGANFGNFELFVNSGPPGSASPLSRVVYDSTGTVQAAYQPEFLFLVNGDDDDDDGYVDNGWDGFNNNPPWPPSPPNPPMPAGYIGNLFTDELYEWEREQWVGVAQRTPLVDSASPTSPSVAWVAANNASPTINAPYTIRRRAVPTSGAREVALPGGIVIDATCWNTTQERSRLPIQAVTLQCDIMLEPSGRWIPNAIYSMPTSYGEAAYLHFWLCDASEVYPRGALWGTGASGPNPNTNPGQAYELPMTPDATANDTANPGYTRSGPGFYPPASSPALPVLKGDRRLVTLSARSGTVVTNTIESIANPFTGAGSPLVPGEGFNVNDVNQPYARAQAGQREAR